MTFCWRHRVHLGTKSIVGTQSWRCQCKKNTSNWHWTVTAANQHPSKILKPCIDVYHHNKHQHGCTCLGVNIITTLDSRDQILHVTKKLNKFCDMICKISNLLSHHRLSDVSQFPCKILNYGVVTKTSLNLLNLYLKNFLCFFFKRIDSLVIIYSHYQILDVFETHLTKLSHASRKLHENPPIFSNRK